MNTGVVSAETSVTELVYQKIPRPIQVGRSDLASSEQVVIPTFPIKQILDFINNELSKEETSLRACYLQL